MKHIAVVLAVLLLSFPAYAQDEVEITNAGVTPDSVFWSVDRTAESASLLFTFDEQTRAAKRLRYAQERLDEAKVMIAAQDIDAAQKAQEAHARSLAAVRRDVNAFVADDATEELQKKAEIQRTIESQQEQVIQIQNKIEIRVRGQLTPDQKEKLDALLKSFSEETATAHNDLAAEEEKAKLKVKAMGGTTENTPTELRPNSEIARTIPPRPSNPLFSSAKFSCDDGTSVTEGMAVQEGQKPICRDYAAWKAAGVKHCAQKDAQLIDIEMGTQCNAPPPNGDVVVTLNTPFELKVGQQARLENMEVIAFYQESVKQSCAKPIPEEPKCPQFSPPAPGWCAEGNIAPGMIDEQGCRGPPRCIASSTQTEEEQVATATTTVPTEQRVVPMPARQEPIALPNRQVPVSLPNERCGEVAVVVLSAIGKKDIAKLRVGEALEVGTFSLRYLIAYPERNAALFELQMGYGDDALPVPMPKPAPEPMPVPTMPVGFRAATVTCSDGVTRTDSATSCMRPETWKDAAVELCARNGASLSDLQFDNPCDLQGTTVGTRGKPIAEEVAVKSATVR